MKGIFHFIERPCNLGSDTELQRQRNGTVYFGTETYLCLPQEYGK